MVEVTVERRKLARERRSARAEPGREPATARERRFGRRSLDAGQSSNARFVQLKAVLRVQGRTSTVGH